MRSSIVILCTAVGSLGAQQLPPVRLIDAPTAQSKHVLGAVSGVRALSDGRLLVNDVLHRQLLLFDSHLASATVVADSVDGANSYGPGAGALVAYVGDSSLFIDPRDLSMFVIDPKGAIARVAAVPRSQDAPMLAAGVDFDNRGRLVYRGGAVVKRLPAMEKGMLTPPEFPDSAAIVRVDLATRKADTAGFFKIAKTKMSITQTDRGMMMTSEINPLPTVDDWTVMADGSVAIVRGQDFHVDWISPDGAATSSPKLPFDWQRLSDDDKAAVIDSARTAIEHARATAKGDGIAAAMGAMAGANVVINMRAGDGGGGRGAPGAGSGMPPLAFVNASDLPDYRPAITAGSAKADFENNLWIRTSATRPGAIGGPIYDIVNRAGQLVDRVQVPAGRQIVGFGKGNVVYMVARDDQGAWLEQTKR